MQESFKTRLTIQDVNKRLNPSFVKWQIGAVFTLALAIQEQGTVIEIGQVRLDQGAQVISE